MAIGAITLPQNAVRFGEIVYSNGGMKLDRATMAGDQLEVARAVESKLPPWFQQTKEDTFTVNFLGDKVQAGASLKLEDSNDTADWPFGDAPAVPYVNNANLASNAIIGHWGGAIKTTASHLDKVAQAFLSV